MFGLSTFIDLKNCSLEKITNKETIQNYVDEICFLLKIKKFGECEIVHFGKDEVAGFTFIQKIETSLVSGHCVDYSRCAFIDIFSCKLYEPKLITKFTCDFFEAGNIVMKKFMRGEFQYQENANLGYHYDN